MSKVVGAVDRSKVRDDIVSRSKYIGSEAINNNWLFLGAFLSPGYDHDRATSTIEWHEILAMKLMVGCSRSESIETSAGGSAECWLEYILLHEHCTHGCLGSRLSTLDADQILVRVPYSTATVRVYSPLVAGPGAVRPGRCGDCSLTPSRGQFEYE